MQARPLALADARVTSCSAPLSCCPSPAAVQPRHQHQSARCFREPPAAPAGAGGLAGALGAGPLLALAALDSAGPQAPSALLRPDLQPQGEGRVRSSQLH